MKVTSKKDSAGNGVHVSFEEKGGCCWLGGSRVFHCFEEGERFIAKLTSDHDEEDERKMGMGVYEEHSAKQAHEFSQGCLEWIRVKLLPKGKTMTVRGHPPEYVRGTGSKEQQEWELKKEWGFVH